MECRYFPPIALILRFAISASIHVLVLGDLLGSFQRLFGLASSLQFACRFVCGLRIGDRLEPLRVRLGTGMRLVAGGGVLILWLTCAT
ncbi:hypothetical protein Sinac_1205 [Singulisphaera acidiphila DSM 18658]|uniref:Uncharacterized protein n=1 Tax=Singulisphaera acidiphila (strain ATCC BAA-1392 / DSM 18658 / VKM B-2454 / MOB10) TaxID=886293 RepID=L0D9Q0_SINAD|nr:hypothetical protein Sinac_1205 [Singulisphaera acidiphila DSM 18658]